MADRSRTYEYYRRAWERRRTRPLPHQPGLTRHATTGPAFVRELELLKLLTSDERFEAALAAIRELRLIDDNCKWNKGIRPELRAQLRDEDSLARVVETMVSRDGFSIRLACASAVAYSFGDLDSCSSFDAAVKIVERAWRKRYKSKLDGSS